MIGKVELGQGGVTAVKQVCADELGVELGRSSTLISGDTATVPDEGTTAGSQTMPNCATAVQQAAAEVREILYDLAAAKLGQPVEGMKVDDGTDHRGRRSDPTYWDLVDGLDLERRGDRQGHAQAASEHAISASRSRASISRPR